jgi:hypothetical protein
MYRIRYFTVVLVLIMVTGCVSYIQTKYAGSDKMYSGPFKTRDQIAVLVQNEAQRVHLEEINGSKVEKKFGVVFELIPGKHLLCIGLSYSQANTKYYSEKCQMVEFTFQAGHTYEFYEVEEKQGDKWHPAVRDITAELKEPGMQRVAEKIDAMLFNARNKKG